MNYIYKILLKFYYEFTKKKYVYIINNLFITII